MRKMWRSWTKYHMIQGLKLERGIWWWLDTKRDTKSKGQGQAVMYEKKQGSASIMARYQVRMIHPQGYFSPTRHPQAATPALRKAMNVMQEEYKGFECDIRDGWSYQLNWRLSSNRFGVELFNRDQTKCKYVLNQTSFLSQYTCILAANSIRRNLHHLYFIDTYWEEPNSWGLQPVALHLQDTFQQPVQWLHVHHSTQEYCKSFLKIRENSTAVAWK